jgi:ankyrin repeat protein
MSIARACFLSIILFASIVCNPVQLYSQWQSIDSLVYNRFMYDTLDYLPPSYPKALDYNLMIASSRGNDNEIKRLIEKGADVNAETDEGATPLTFAISNNRLSAVRTLLNYNPQLNTITKIGESPLLLAVKNNNSDITEVLIRAGAEIDFIDPHGATSLHYSAINGYLNLVDLLLYYNAKIDLKSNEGTTPLLAAVWAGYTDVAELLIKNGANMETRDNDGFTPFLMAAYYGDTLLLNVLFKNGVDIYAVTKNHQNALSLSIASDHPQTTALLLKMGKDWTNPVRNAIDPYKVVSTYHRSDMLNMLKKNNIKGNIKYGIDQVSVTASMRTLSNDFYSGLRFALKEPYLNGGFSFGIDTKLWYTRVLIKSSDHIFYQYRDKGSVAYAGIFKDFAITDRSYGLNYSISTSLSGGYYFGNQLKGTRITTGNKFNVIPSVNLNISRFNSSVSMGIEYTKTEYYYSGPVWFRLGYSYNYFFENVRIRVKPIPWY